MEGGDAGRGRRENGFDDIKMMERNERSNGVSGEKAEKIAVNIVLVETRMASEGDAELRHAGLDAVVTAVERRVTMEALILETR